MRTIAPLLGVMVTFIFQWSLYGQVQPATLNVIDASNTVIGPVIDDFGGSVETSLLVDSYVIRAAVSQTTLMGRVGNSTVFFASGNCSGQAFVEWAPGYMSDPHAIVTLSNSVYAGPLAPQQTITYNSRLDPGVSGCQVSTGSLNNVMPVTFIRNLPFQAPFRLQASPALASIANAPAFTRIGLIACVLLLSFIAIYLLRTAA